MPKTITPRQMQILTFIRDFRHNHGFSPSMQEIGEALGLTKVTVFEHIGALERKGLLLRGAKHSARSLQISPAAKFPDDRLTCLPLAGRIAAGLPIEAIEDNESIDLEAVFASDGQTFALQVTGDSMVDDHICDGDYVICQRTNQARNGQVVVALLDDGEATLKRFYKESGRIRLQPANAAYEPIYADSVQIQGIVIGVIRTL